MEYQEPVKLLRALSSSSRAFLPSNFDISANPFTFLVDRLLPYAGCAITSILPYLPQPVKEALYIEVG